VQFDHEQHVQPGQADRLNGKEVASEDALGLGAQKLAPGGSAAARCRPEVMPAQDAANRVSTILENPAMRAR